MKYIVEGIFTYETDAKDPREANRMAIKKLSSKNVRICVVNSFEKKEVEHEEY